KHPRQNVLLEIGMAMGLSRGLERLIVLKHRDATLPSDLGGVLTLNFDDDVSATFPELETRLRELGIDFSAQGRPDSAGRPG
ncbi:MAG: TIR domain-containing protein, partial [Longimicrobiaceae bacterium]